MPWRRKHWIRVVLQERDDAAEEQQDEAERQAAHDENMRRQGYQPGATGG